MFSEPVIRLKGVGKCYQIYDKPHDRLLQMLVRNRKQYFREFWALRDISLEVRKGECLGIVGRNGAGKSTLLQIICGTLAPSHGDVHVNGRVAALLELGAGFNPEFTGRENVFYSAAIMGLSKDEIASRYDEIVSFSGIGDFIDQPIKTYSSGMYVRLAFSVATSVNPDILVIDEALSVGDGAFARKSFDRIMDLREKGVTILFCSHSLYQVDALCSKAVWLDKGTIRFVATAALVTSAYGQHLDAMATHPEEKTISGEPLLDHEDTSKDLMESDKCEIIEKLLLVDLSVNNDAPEKKVNVVSNQDDIKIIVSFRYNLENPAPNIGIGFTDKHGRIITSAGSHIDKILLNGNEYGEGSIEVIFPKFSLLKGEYLLNVYLLCERGIHLYDVIEAVAALSVSQTHIEQGVVSLPHIWKPLPFNPVS